MEPRSLLVTRHDPSTFPKIVVKMLPIFGTLEEPRKNFEDEKNFVERKAFSKENSLGEKNSQFSY